MNRRQFLAMSGAGAAVLAAGKMGLHSVMAQGVQYEMIDVVAFARTADGKSGAFRKISDDGLIAGYDLVNGVLAPATWNAAGKRTVLDTRGLSYTQIGDISMNGAGKMTAVLVNTDANSFETLLWEKPDAGATVFGSQSWVSFIAPNGNMSGQAKHVPTRWIGDATEAIDIPAGQTEGNVAAINDAGDAIVLFRNRTDVISHPPVLWHADGKTQQLEWPADVTDATDVTRFIPNANAVFENGDFSLTYTIAGQDVSGTHSVVYRAGVPESVQSADGDASTSIVDAMGAEFMIGGKSVWIDHEPYLIQDLVAEPVVARWIGLYGTNTQREIAGVAGLDDGAPHGVVFRPVE